MSRYDVVIYGITGFTGTYILRNLVNNINYEGLTYAVAGRNKQKIQNALAKVSEKTGKDVSSTPIIIADSSDPESLAQMARQANVIVNSVGPYTIHGEAVIKAAVENGAHHLDVSGEFPWIEEMQAKYHEEAKKNGVFIISACGFDSIPADLGINFLKKNFDGDLNHVESFVEFQSGPEGYSLNDGTYQTVILIISRFLSIDRSVKQKIMPQRIVRGNQKTPFRFPVTCVSEEKLNGYAVTFKGTDDAIVERSQYYGATVNEERPIHFAPFVFISKLAYTIALAFYLSVFTPMALIPFTRKLLQKYPDQCTFNYVKKYGPTEEQVEGASFDYWLFGYGYQKSLPFDQQHTERIDRKVVVKCHAPDAAYNATSSCILSSALAILKDRDSLPKEGGVYTTASALGKSKIYDYLSSFGVHFTIESSENL